MGSEVFLSAPIVDFDWSPGNPFNGHCIFPLLISTVSPLTNKTVPFGVQFKTSVGLEVGSFGLFYTGCMPFCAIFAALSQPGLVKNVEQDSFSVSYALEKSPLLTQNLQNPTTEIRIA